MEVIVLVRVQGGATSGEVGFPTRPWPNLKWRGYPDQLLTEGIFGTVSRLLTDMRIAA